MNKIDKKLPFVSVIIPTYYDWKRLQLCINALKNKLIQKKI